jgi:hypothetical protein
MGLIKIYPEALTMEKKPYVMTRLTIKLKNVPSKYVGPVDRTIDIGLDDSVTLPDLIVGAAASIIEFYQDSLGENPVTFQNAKQEAAARILNLKIE